METSQTSHSERPKTLDDGNLSHISLQSEVISQFDKGQLVVVKEDRDDVWYCGHVVDVYPKVTVRLPAGGSAFTWDQVCHCDDLDEDALSKVLGWNWIAEQSEEEMVMPPGLEDEDRYIYPVIRARAEWSFVFATTVSFAAGAVFFNLAWLLLANQVNDGPGLQNYTWYACFFDTFYMTIKGLTFSSFLCTFLTEPEQGHRIYLYILQALLFPIVNLLFHALWKFSDSILDMENRWVMLKVNQPCAALIAMLICIAPCLLIEYGRTERRAALLRFVSLVLILFTIVGGIVMSHLFFHLFLAYEEGHFGTPKTALTQGFMEIVWVTAYAQGYITVLGKLFKCSLRVCDVCSPMSDIQRQRMIYVLELVLESQRILYTREMLLLKQGWVAIFFITREVVYDAFHYGVKACPTYEAALLISFKPKSLFQCGILVRFFQARWMEWLTFVAMMYADLLEMPKFLSTAFVWDVDTGYPGKSATKSILFSETCVNVHRMPAQLDEEFDGWAESKKKVRIWDRHTKGLCFDDAHARNVMDEKLPDWARHMEGFKDPGRAKFYRQLTIRIGGIIFSRFRARIGVKLSCSLLILLRMNLIPQLPSKEVLNRVYDHTQLASLGSESIAVAFLITDLVSWIFTGHLQFWQIAGTRAELFRLVRFARLFASNVYLFMVFWMHVSLNSDVYITWANLRFGE